MADPNNWFDGQVEAVNAWAEATVPDEGGGGDPGGGDGEVHAVALLPIPSPLLVGQTVTVTVFAADSEGNPVPDAAVTLLAVGAGHVITPADTASTDATGYATFTLTVVGSGNLDVMATAAGFDSRTQRVFVGLPSVYNGGGGGGGGGGGRKRRQPGGAAVSYSEIGPISASASARARPSAYASQPSPPGRSGGQSAQAAAAIATDQQRKLQALMQKLQADLS